MKQRFGYGMVVVCFALAGCQPQSNYHEAELIRKIDALQVQVDALTQKVADLQQIHLPSVTTTAVTTTTQPPTQVTKKTPSKTTKAPVTTKTNSSTTTAHFKAEDFQERVDGFRNLISELSQQIAVSLPKEDETEKFDQFYQYQEGIHSIGDGLINYQTILKAAYDEKQLSQEEFMEKERILSKMHDALGELENQLEVKFGIDQR